MADIIDYLFVFWVLLTILVYVIGSFFEKQKQNNSKFNQQQNRNLNSNRLNELTNSQDASSWCSPTKRYSNYDSTTTQQQQQQYNNNNNSNQQSSYSNYNLADSASGPNYYGQSINDNQQQAANYNYNYNSTTLSTEPPRSTSSFYNEHQHLNFLNEPSAIGGGLMNEQQQLIYNSDDFIPIATGFNSDCVDWVNNILYLFYTQTEKYGPIITENIYRSLNEKLTNILNSNQEYKNLIVEFKGINRSLSSKPELTNLRTEIESEKSVSAQCKIYNKMLVLDLSIQKQAQRRTTTNLNYEDFHQSGRSSNINQSNQEDDEQVYQYELILENLEGKLKSVAMLNDKLIIVQFIEKPDTKILLKPKSSSFNHQYNYNNPLINEDYLVSIILQTITQVVVDFYFGDDLDFPRYKQTTSSSSFKNKFNLFKGSASELKRHIKQDFFGAMSGNTSSNMINNSMNENKERKILIKILKAKNINYNQNVTCLIELDLPYQQAASSMKQGSNPYWDEHFLFNINEKSNEVLFELWDSISIPQEQQKHQQQQKEGSGSGGSLKRGSSFSKLTQLIQNNSSSNKWSKDEITSSGKFLGSAKVLIEDLRRNPMQKVNLMLGSNSSEKNKLAAASSSSSTTTNNQQTSSALGNSVNINDDSADLVGGELIVELLFLEHASGGGAATRNSRSSNRAGDVVSVDRKLTPSGYVITTTTITKPSSSQQQQQQQQQLLVRNPSPISQSSTTSDLDLIQLDGYSRGSQAGDAESFNNRRGKELQADNRSSRSRSRSRSLLRAIKKRFSFSRTRSRSVGESGGFSRPESAQTTPAISTNLDLHNFSDESRSQVSDLSMLSGGAASTRAKSVPVTRNPSELPLIVINSNRDGGGGQMDRRKSENYPKSQLVIECTEPKLLSDGTVDKKEGRLRHYAVPDDFLSQAKWRKRGLKLHLVHDHQFVACHISGSHSCYLCGRLFSRRPGKQGYECRNCHISAHKECHTRVDHRCPFGLKDGQQLELEYIDADPPACLIDESSSSSRRGESLPRETTSNRQAGIRLVNKSISMDIDDR